MGTLVGDSFFGLDLNQIKAGWSRFRRRISKRILLLDFDLTHLTMAQIRIHDEVFDLDHIRRFPLPEEALERGVPTDPAQMANLIKAYCKDQGVPAHRAAVVLTPEAAFTTQVVLPSRLSPSEALAHVLNPSSGVQVPIQLSQMDVDLIPLDLPNASQDQRHYFLAAVPRKQVDRLLETLNLAELELIRMQLGMVSQLQQLGQVVQGMRPCEVIIHVELLRECSLVTLLTSKGPLKVIRLTAIREFPELPESTDQNPSQQILNAEQLVIASDRYLPLSELDLRRLITELKQLLQDICLQYPWIEAKQMILAGPNSAHPMLAKLLEELMELPVDVARPLTTAGVGTIHLDQALGQQSLGRLVGLGLSFLERLSLQTSDFDALDSSESSSDELPSDEMPESIGTLESDLLIDDLPIETLDDVSVVSLSQAIFSESEAVQASTASQISSSVPGLEDQFSSLESNNDPLVRPVEVKDEPTPGADLVFALIEDGASQQVLSGKVEESPLSQSLDVVETVLPARDDGGELPFSLDDLLHSYESHVVGSLAQDQSANPSVVDLDRMLDHANHAPVNDQTNNSEAVIEQKFEAFNITSTAEGDSDNQSQL